MSSTLRPLDLFAAPLTAINLIEASAGTGKTFTIAGLYIRLLLEAERRVDQIVVVTFTNAATEELKHRIRQRLLQTRDAIKHQQSADSFCQQLLQTMDGEESTLEIALKRLDNALRGFDEAAIYTIHSFCQRVLKDRAFASGMAFESELQTDTRALLQDIVADFWRLHFYQGSLLLIDYLLDNGYTPEHLLSDIAPYLGKPYLKVVTVQEPDALTLAETTFSQAYKKARSVWLNNSARNDVEKLLLDNKSLNGNKYRKSSLPNWFMALDEYFQAESATLKVFNNFEKFTSSKLTDSVKKGQQAPEHLFFDHCDELWQALQTLSQHYQTNLQALRAKLLDYCNTELEQRKREQQIQSYDDLLTNLHKALQGAGGESLAHAIRQRYSAALIDEFQDTDPIQYDIFRAIYGGSDLPVFIVGDPKQAIYSFRGADVFAYLRAHSEAAERFTLDKNWRSEPDLIQGVNALFDNAAQPFLLDNINFLPVHAAAQTREQLQLADTDITPLQIWFMAANDEQETLNKGTALEMAAQATATEIARLLNLATAGNAQLGERPLTGGDIAILVRNHRQGTLIRQCLLALDVPSVQRADDDVFASVEAQELEWLLLAVQEPSRETLIRAALATQLLGLTAAQILNLEQDEQQWEQWLDRFYHYHQQWREQGFATFFNHLLRENNIQKRLLSLHDGERRLTNVLHIVELLHTAARQQRLGLEGLLKWLSERRQSSYREEEEHQLRLESDAQLVQIVTIHKSKGLEYPIVFCPFLWDGKIWSERDTALSFHDPSDDFLATLDFGSERLEEHRLLAKNEELAENLRLLYVALTRAKQRCYMIWGRIKEAGSSAPAWLLHRPTVITPDSDLATATAERFESMTASSLRLELTALAERVPDSIVVTDLPALTGPLYRPPVTDNIQFNARHFAGFSQQQWRVGSFSALTVQHGAELPDHDGLSWTETQPSTTGATEHTIFSFPRGARAGSCLHKLFEEWEFTNQDNKALHSKAEDILQQHGFSIDWANVVTAMVRHVLNVPLSDDLKLSQISSQQCLVELEFYYPLAHLEAKQFSDLLLLHGELPESFVEAVSNLSFPTLQGYMKGYIDLVFESQDKFYIVDYKSNWLGGQLTDYSQDRMTAAIIRDDYYLQYFIYTIAVHRYLKQRLVNYDYQQHFGGVFYLFLRGIDPTQPQYGVFRQRPPAELIDCLDRYLTGDKIVTKPS